MRARSARLESCVCARVYVAVCVCVCLFAACICEADFSLQSPTCLPGRYGHKYPVSCLASLSNGSIVSAGFGNIVKVVCDAVFWDQRC